MANTKLYMFYFLSETNASKKTPFSYQIYIVCLQSKLREYFPVSLLTYYNF